MRPRRQRAPDPPQPARGGRLYPALVLGALAMAALLRLVAFFQLRGLPNVTSDGLFYQGIAEKIVDGSYLRQAHAFDFSPLYVFVLAAVFQLFGHSLNAVRVVQFVLGLGSCGLIFAIARRLLDRTGALIALALAALYVPFIHFEGQLLGITLAMFLMLLSLHLLLAASARATPALLVPAGLCLGLATLSAPTLLVLAAPVTLWLALLRGSVPPARPRLTAHGTAQAGLYVGAVLLGILPATLWNHRATGELVLVSSQGGVNFFIGNNPEATGFFVVPRGMEDSLAGINVTGARRVAEAEVRHPLTPSQVSRHWFAKGLRFLTDEPLGAARLFLRKAFLFANHYEVPLDLDQQAFRAYFPLLGWSPLSFGVVSLLGWMGLAVALRSFRRHALAILLLGTYALSVVAFFVSDRYRLPAVPLLIIFSAFTITWARDKLRDKQPLPPLVAGLAGVVGAALIVFAPAGLQGSPSSLAFNMATGYLQQKDLPRARAELQACVQQDPSWVEARYKLALVNHQLGDALAALEGVDVVVARAPRNADAHELRGRILLKQGLAVTALRELEDALALTPGNQAIVDQRDQARRMIQETGSPASQDLLATLNADGWRHLDARQFPAAIATFAELLASTPPDAPARDMTLAGLGFSYASQGRLDLAIRAFDDAVAINPQNPILHKNLALLHLKQGHADQARPHVDRFAALSPGDPLLPQLAAALAGRGPPPNAPPTSPRLTPPSIR